MGYNIGKVIDVNDPQKTGRIKVRLENVDKHKSNSQLQWASPLMPKMFQITPKVGESVYVFFESGNPLSERGYVGPIISDMQFIEYDDHDLSANKYVGGLGIPTAPISDSPQADGTMPFPNETSINGRKNADIIIGENDIRIRCGYKLIDNLKKSNINIRLNKKNPSYIKLKYFEKPLKVNKMNFNGNSFVNNNAKEVESVVNFVGQEINLISTEGSPYINTSNTNQNVSGQEGISDEDLKKFIESAHPMVYGDNLVKLLKIIIDNIANHTHNYNNLPAVADANLNKLKGQNLNNILSKNIRLN